MLLNRVFVKVLSTIYILCDYILFRQTVYGVTGKYDGQRKKEKGRLQILWPFEIVTSGWITICQQSYKDVSSGPAFSFDISKDSYRAIIW